MYKLSVLGWLVIGLLLVQASLIQAEVMTPEQLGRFTIGVGGRTIGMGGVSVALAEDASAAYYNPAGLVQLKRFSMPLDLGGRVENIDKWRDLTEDLKELLDKEPYEWKYPEDWDTAKRLTKDAANAPIKGEISFLGGLAFHNFALTAFAQGKADASLGYYDTPGASHYIDNPVADWGDHSTPDPITGAPTGGDPDNPIVNVRAGGYAIVGQVVSFAKMVKPKLALGVNIKWLRGFYYPYSYYAEGYVDPVTLETGVYTPTNEYDDSEDDTIGFDIGLLRFLPNKVTFGFTIMNVNAPSFTFQPETGTPYKYSLKLERVMNAGIIFRPTKKFLCGADWNNITGAYGDGSKLNLGAEWELVNFLKLRAGWLEGEFTKGATLRIGGLKFDIAAGPEYKTYACLSAGLLF